jgi:hypothetical protein
MPVAPSKQVKGEQLANNERAGLLRAKLLGLGDPARSQKADRQDGRIDKPPAHRHQHHATPIIDKDRRRPVFGPTVVCPNEVRCSW